MNKIHIPSEEELDTLLGQQPQFNLEAVKRRTLSRVGGAAERPARKRRPLRGILIAAVVCALSISAMAAADFATNGRITMALGIQKPQTEPVEEPAPPAEEPLPVQEAAPPSPVEPEPEPERPAEPPELDGQIADALQINQAQARQLRPAVQAVEMAAENRDVRMTVLQTLGDPSYLYIKLRFDFPEAAPASEYLEFQKIQISFADEELNGYGWQETVLERSERSITYLMTLFTSGVKKDLNGQMLTVSFENYGTPHQYTEDEVVHLAGEAGKPYTTIINPDGTMRWDVTESDLAALPAEAGPAILYSDGFTVSRRVDGSKVVTYDGEHGDQMRDVYLVPDFDIAVEGKWEQSWTLAYQDISRYWAGEAEITPNLTLTGIRLSPLSWSMDFTAIELTGEELGLSLLYGKGTAQLRHRDGSLTELMMSHTSAHGNERQEGIYTISDMTLFGRVDQDLDLSDVTAVLIEGREFPLN